MEIKDIGGVSAPLSKLVEVVSSAIGTYYRPKAIRNEADARAYEIKVLSRAQVEADEVKADIQIAATKNRIEELIRQHPELAERARMRLLTREVEGQLNIEKIAEHAVAALPSTVSPEPLNADWRRKFFLEAENVCEHDLQVLWGKVLAGEIASPGAFGLRTLDTLRQLSQVEAEYFRLACSIAMAGGWIAIPGNDLNTSLEPFGLRYSNLLALRDAGLVLDGDHIHQDFSKADIKPDGNPLAITLFNNGLLIEISGPAIFRKFPALVFTRAGRDLQKLNGPSPTEEYFKALGKSLRGKHLIVKRGMVTPQDGNTSLITFDVDL